MRREKLLISAQLLFSQVEVQLAEGRQAGQEVHPSVAHESPFVFRSGSG